MGAISHLHGFISDQWQKAPIPFGFSGQVLSVFQNLGLSAGTNSLSGALVPEGEIWVITNISVVYQGTIGSVELKVRLVGSVLIFLFTEETIVSGRVYARQGEWILISPNKLLVEVVNATQNDDLFLHYSGYRIDIDK